MNEYEIACVVGGAISLCLVASSGISFITQWVLAWVEDEEVSELNWVMMKFSPGAFKYKADLSREPYAKETYTVFIRDKLPVGDVIPLEEHATFAYGEDYMYTSNHVFMFACTVSAIAFIPLVFLLAYKVYPLALTLVVIVMLAFLARTVKRDNKMFTAHTEDEKLHKKKCKTAK